MIQGKASYPDYVVARSAADEARLSAGLALLAVFGLSLIGWAFVLVPLVTLFHR